MAKRWRIRPHDSDRIEALARAAGVSYVLAELLVVRGITEPAAISSFLEPKLVSLHDPGLLPGCEVAAQQIHEAIRAGRRIVIYGDYDVDGITSTSLLWRCFKMLGADVGYYIPLRQEEGYGLNLEAVRKLAAGEGTIRPAEMIVTVDCGINSTAEAALAAELGVELIVTDHHQPGEVLPQASAVVHPRLPGTDYPFGGLAGVGVAYKLAWALCQHASQAVRVGERMRRFLLEATGLAAIGTVADMVPLVDENRPLVTFGLESLKARPILGIEALARTAKIDHKHHYKAEDVGFSLGPRLNAAGRLGQARLAVELLISDDRDRADELAVYMDKLNADRQSLERRMTLAANKQIKHRFDPAQDAAMVLADPSWNPGVIGIVAGRLAEKYHRPVIMVACDKVGTRPAVGSGRSVPGLNLADALTACESYLLGHGGHAAAAGLQIDEGRIDAFREAFCDYVAAKQADVDTTPELVIDGEAPFSSLTARAVREIERMAPFGQGNPRPVLCTTDVRLAEPPKKIGSGERHLSLKLIQHQTTFRAVAFGGGEWADALAALDGPIDVAFRPVINDFRGKQNVELHLVDWQTPQDRLATGAA